MLTGLHPAEIALLLESVPPRQRELVWNMVDPELEGDVLLELSEGVRQELIEEMETEELVAAAEGMELDDLADLVRELPETVTMQVLRSMDQRDRERLRNVLSWPEDSAGGLMNTDTVSVRPDVTLEVVLRYLRMRGELPSRTDSLFVVDRDDRYLGTILLTRIITGDPENTVGDSLDTDAPRIEPDMPAHDVARLFQERDLVSAAVVDSSGSLLGRITIDDVVDVIREEAAHEVMSMAGLKDEEDLFAGIVPSTRRRLLWLGINLLTAFLAAAVVKNFEATIEKVAALAALLPIVASMGGIAGTQTVTLLIRGLALGQVQWSNARWLLFKEIAVGGLNGLIWAVVVGAVTVVWFGTWQIAAIIAAAMLINLLAAAAVGVLVPLALRRLDIDPALSAGVILTTFTDCIGFATLLGLGALRPIVPFGSRERPARFPRGCSSRRDHAARQAHQVAWPRAIENDHRLDLP
jgi:magnesium transporter